MPVLEQPSGEGLQHGEVLTLAEAGRMFDELTLLRAAHAYERQTAWWKAQPTL